MFGYRCYFHSTALCRSLFTCLLCSHILILVLPDQHLLRSLNHPNSPASAQPAPVSPHRWHHNASRPGFSILSLFLSPSGLVISQTSSPHPCHPHPFTKTPTLNLCQGLTASRGRAPTLLVFLLPLWLLFLWSFVASPKSVLALFPALQTLPTGPAPAESRFQHRLGSRPRNVTLFWSLAPNIGLKLGSCPLLFPPLTPQTLPIPPSKHPQASPLPL